MKRIFYIAAIACFAALAVACSKDNPIQPDPDHPTARLVSVTKTESFTPSEFVDKLSACTYASWLGIEDYVKPLVQTFVATRRPEVWSVIKKETGNSAADNWCVKKINFDYRTVDVKGDSVTMSGAICYLDNVQGYKGHTLSSISLVCHTFLKYNTDCPTLKGDLSMGRALWNSLVVLPDMQGYGTAKALGDGMKMGKSCVNQVIDCERVAIELAKSKGLKFASDYHTDVMGYSLGCGVMMAVARAMEEANEKDAALFKYHDAFVGGGVYDMFAQGADLFRNETRQSQTQFMGFFMLPINTYLVPESKLAGYKPEDFYSAKYLTTISTIDGKAMNPSNFSLWKYDKTEENSQLELPLYGFFKDADAFKGAFAEDMSTDSLVLDPSTPKTKILKALCDKEITYTDWKPTHRITIFQPDNDEMIPVSFAETAYNTLINNGGGSLVGFETFTIPSILTDNSMSPHFVGTAVGQLRMLMYEDPAEKSDVIDFILQQIGKL